MDLHKIIWQLIERLKYPWVLNTRDSSVEEKLEGEFDKVEAECLDVTEAHDGEISMQFTVR